MKARDVMTSPVITVAPDAPVADIATLLIERRISGVLVVDGKGQVVGIVTEGDLLHRHETATERRQPWWLKLLSNRSDQASEFLKTHGVQAEDVMTRTVVTISADADLAEIARTLEKHGIKRVPVIEDGKLVGVVSRANLLHGLVASRRKAEAEPVAADDSELRRSVYDRLGKEVWIDRNRLNLVVNDGVVHVWGLVESEDQRRALRVAVEEVPGVRSIEDHTTIDRFAHSPG